jgi:hypothetical protein
MDQENSAKLVKKIGQILFAADLSVDEAVSILIGVVAMILENEINMDSAQIITKNLSRTDDPYLLSISLFLNKMSKEEYSKSHGETVQ